MQRVYISLPRVIFQLLLFFDASFAPFCQLVSFNFKLVVLQQLTVTRDLASFGMLVVAEGDFGRGGKTYQLIFNNIVRCIVSTNSGSSSLSTYSSSSL